MTQRGLYDERGKPLPLRSLAEVYALRDAKKVSAFLARNGGADMHGITGQGVTSRLWRPDPGAPTTPPLEWPTSPFLTKDAGTRQ